VIQSFLEQRPLPRSSLSLSNGHSQEVVPSKVPGRGRAAKYKFKLVLPKRCYLQVSKYQPAGWLTEMLRYSSVPWECRAAVSAHEFLTAAKGYGPPKSCVNADVEVSSVARWVPSKFPEGKWSKIGQKTRGEKSGENWIFRFYMKYMLLPPVSLRASALDCAANKRPNGSGQQRRARLWRPCSAAPALSWLEAALWTFGCCLARWVAGALLLPLSLRRYSYDSTWAQI
jgi:hypothetical protein